MNSPESPEESLRLARLAESRASDPATAALLDALTDLAAELTHCPWAWLSFATAAHEFICSAHGPTPHTIDRAGSMLQAVIDTRGPVSIDYPTAQIPLGKDLLIAYCAGAPIVSGSGEVHGGIFVASDRPHALSNEQRQGLTTLAEAASRILELNRSLIEARAELAARIAENGRLATALEKMQAETKERDVRVAALSEKAATDSKTGLHDFGSLRDHLERRLATNEPFAFLLIDIDWFKNFNDAYGLLAGDDALRTVANLLTADDVFTARYGGEEFGLVLDSIDTQSALEFGEALRKRIERHPWPNRPITVCVGIALRTPEIHSFEELVARANAALFAAKKTGKNRVLAWSHA